MFTNKCTYNDFIKSDEGIATNILAARLKSLEENGIIEKLDHPESKAKKLYKLTQKGMELLPLLMEIYFWTDKYFKMPAELKATIKEAKKDKDKFIKQVFNDLKSK
jgi:DNA-binding HxlR family transcriptional regulator